MRGRGYIRSCLSKCWRFGSALALLGASPSFPPSASILSHAPRRLNQGQTSSCGGHGTSAAIYATCSALGRPLAFVPSPKGIYDDVRCLERAVLPDGQLAPLQDNGIEPADLIPALSREGVRSIRAPTPDGRYSDVTEENVNSGPTSADDAESQQHLVLGLHAIDTHATDFHQQVAASIASGRAVGVGIWADDAFENWTAGSPPLDGVADFSQPGRGHWVCVLAYKTLPDGRLAFQIVNSWGDEWGDHGTIWVTEWWLRSSCMEALVFDVQLPGAA